MSDTVSEALVACVKALGGSKVIGPKLRPEMEPGAAQRWLLDCLNDDRPPKLSPEQALLIFRWARDRGCHVGMHYMAGYLAYAMPAPIEPVAELADLLRQSIEASREQQRRQEAIERLLSVQTSGGR